MARHNMTEECLEQRLGRSRKQAARSCERLLSAQAKTLKAGSEVSIPIEICEYIAETELGITNAWEYIRALEEQAGGLSQIVKDAEEYLSRLEALITAERTDEVISILQEENFTGVSYH